MNNRDTPVTEDILGVHRLLPRNQEQRPAKFLMQHSAKTVVATVTVCKAVVSHRRVRQGFDAH